MMMTNILRNTRQLTTVIKQKAHELGYVSCGITDASPFTEFLDAIERRIQRYPESIHLYQNLRENGYPKEQAEWVQSVIVCVRRYGKYKLPHGPAQYFGKCYLVDGRLPYTEEYHAFGAFQAFLKGLGMSVIVPRLTDRWAAARAGLGQFGKNNFLYTADGSWIGIKVLLVDKALEYDAPQTAPLCPDQCTRCIDSCPTHALEGPFMMNYGRCIAHLTFHLTTLPSEDIRKPMGTWMYGCDLCQNVCPLNHGKWEPAEQFPQLDEVAHELTLDRLFRMTQPVYEQIIQPRFWYITKENLWIWKSNALRAMANSGVAGYHPLIKEACNDPIEPIQQMAHWAEKNIG
jgi:epoxyqueuosine reductase